jgi:serine/threonine protein kinase/tetratricopeptide (TPR) repeat protein
MIGRYRLLQKIGEGGFGIVYMAEQKEPVKRRLALKIIKIGMDTREVVSRFEAERQALALMDHPNIAKVLDAGATETGRPYFVMELVRGTRITDYCDEQNLPTLERLKLFTQVCQAVQHAHQKGIIHRDLKPSNILVTLNDGVAVPKIIDFGIAKATQVELTDKTVFTRFQQFIGTPAYMSPEQADLTSVDIDTRTDIYSLGVLLYELLTGKTPFDSTELLQAGLEAMRRTIREKEPPKPSTRLSTLRGDELTTTAKRHGLEPPKLISRLCGDLDWIVMKCLEKDRARRYETANGLARDIQRHLGNEPVTAGPPGPRYRIGKFVRRNKWLIVASACVLAVLTLGILASVWEARQQSRLRQQAQRAQANEAREKVKAQTEAAKSDQVAQFLTDMLAGVGPSVALGRDTTILKEILDKTAERVGKELTNQPEVAIEVLKTLANTYHELGLYPQMEKMATESLRLARTALPEQNPEVGRTLQVVAMAQWEQGRYEEAERSQREGLALQRKALGNQDAEVGTSLNSLGLVLESRGKFAEAEAMFREAVAVWRKSRGEDIDLANNLSNLGMALREQGKLVEAEAVRREALAIDRKLLGNEHPDVAASLCDLATVLKDEDKSVEAEAMFRDALTLRQKTLGQEHPLVALSLHNLAAVLADEGKLAEAESLSRQALAMYRKLLGNENPQSAGALSGLAFVLKEENKLGEAEGTYREALALLRKLLGNDHPHVALTLKIMAQVLQDERKLAEAETTAREAVSISRKVLDPNDPDVATALAILRSILVDEAKSSPGADFSEAESVVRQCLALREKNLPDDWRTFTAQNMLGGILLLEKRYAEAEPLLLSGYSGMKERGENSIGRQARSIQGSDWRFSRALRGHRPSRPGRQMETEARRVRAIPNH